MNIALWIAQILLALAFLGAGITKLKDDRLTYAANRPPMTTFAERLSTPFFKTLGVLELLGAIALIVPWATGIAPILTPIAAVGLALIMVGALVDHAKHGEKQAYPVNLVLGALAILVAIGRF
ncbi:DoxX family protein [Demequina aurantiaca]|uniref:DoxX family protein n=1 Tax=Demequina aurantiaca TaxID=676200 RepID=UPI00078171E3|nr:DoxX family protein [Demequina aurantiaca]